MEKFRLDVLLYNLGLAMSREKAKHIILADRVYVDGKLANKASLMFEASCIISIVKPQIEYVGRGAYKLEKAVQNFGIKLTNKIALDVGASTGGFTDFMLKNGCKKVYAVDVGQNQLRDSLLIDNRVVSLEKTNFRYIDVNLFKEDIDFICIDVSFISLELIMPKVVEICNEKTEVVALVKPQFEAGKGNIGKKGIVKDKKMHLSILSKVYSYCAQNSLYINDIIYSPITGGDGNIEYLVYIKKTMNLSFENNLNNKIKNIVYDAFESLK